MYLTIACSVMFVRVYVNSYFVLLLSIVFILVISGLFWGFSGYFTLFWVFRGTVPPF